MTMQTETDPPPLANPDFPWARPGVQIMQVAGCLYRQNFAAFKSYPHLDCG
jgi:hypothetical protein